MNKLNVTDMHLNEIRIDNSLQSSHSHAIRNIMLSSQIYQNNSYKDYVFLNIENGQSQKKLRPIQKAMVAYSEILQTGGTKK